MTTKKPTDTIKKDEAVIAPVSVEEQETHLKARLLSLRTEIEQETEQLLTMIRTMEDRLQQAQRRLLYLRGQHDLLAQLSDKGTN